MTDSQFIPAHWRFQDLASQVFGVVTVVSYYGRINKVTLWNCECECGNQIKVTAGNLKKGNTTCCGKCYSQPKSDAHDSWLRKNLLNRSSVSELGCWMWDGPYFNTGYGSIRIRGKTRTAHSLSYELFNGENPDGLCVCHSCDNPSCCNPEHLFLGTNKQNSEDMVKKGRQAKGSRVGLSKLKSSDVAKIRILIIHNKSYVEIAKMFCVHPSSIRNIAIRKTWKYE